MRNHNISCKKLRMEDVLLKLFVFSTWMQTNSSCFVKSYNIFSLN